MENVKLFKQILNDIENSKIIKLEKYGILREKINENIHVYDPNDESLSTIIGYYSFDNLNKISFAGLGFKISLQELELALGPYRYTYNFRDNFTQFFFDSMNNFYKVKSITLKKDNNIFKENGDFFTEKDPKGNINQLKNIDLLFNNFSLHLK